MARWVLAVALVCGPFGAAQADAGPFSQGRSRIAISGGSAGGFGGERYLVLGATYGYFLVDGLELGMGAQAWLLGDPSVYTLTPQVRYVLHFVPVLKPYVGGFFSRWFVGGDGDDLSTMGARAGAFYVTGGGGFVGGGVVVETILDCQLEDDADCTDIYPEIAFSIVF